MDEKRIAERVAYSVTASSGLKSFESDYWELVYKIKEKAAGALTKAVAKRLEKLEADMEGFSFNGDVRKIARDLVVQTYLSGDDPQWSYDNFMRQGYLRLEPDTKVARELIAGKKPGIELLTLNKKRLARQLGNKMSDWVSKHTSGWFQGSQAESNAREAMLEFLQRELGRKYDLNDESEDETLEFMEDLIIFE